LGLLGTETERVQNAADVVWVVRDLELALDYFGNPAARPQIRGKASGQWTVDHDLPQSVALVRRQPGTGASWTFDFKGRIAALLEGFLPAFHARQADTQQASGFRKRHPIP
jgi:hypothetical protein